MKQLRGKGAPRAHATLDDFFLQTPAGEIIKFWRSHYLDALQDDEQRREKKAKGAANEAAAKHFGCSERQIQRVLKQFAIGAAERAAAAETVRRQRDEGFETYQAVETIMGVEAFKRLDQNLDLAAVLPDAVRRAAVILPLVKNLITQLRKENAQLGKENAKLRAERDAAVKRASKAEAANPYR